MNKPDWFPSVPLWVAVDPAFCLLSYFNCIDGGIYQPPIEKDSDKQREDINTLVESLELISTYKEVFSIYWDCDNRTILVTDSKTVWKSRFLSFIPIEVSQGEQYLIGLAEKFIDSLLILATLPNKEFEDIDNFTTKKFIADFHDIVDFELIATYKEVFSIYWDWDNQTILVSDSEAAWESEFISLIPIGKSEREEHLISLAEKFIDALLLTLPDERQLELFTVGTND